MVGTNPRCSVQVTLVIIYQRHITFYSLEREICWCLHCCSTALINSDITWNSLYQAAFILFLAQFSSYSEDVIKGLCGAMKMDHAAWNNTFYEAVCTYVLLISRRMTDCTSLSLVTVGFCFVTHQQQSIIKFVNKKSILFIICSALKADLVD